MLKYGFWYDYVKPKHNEKAKLCYMDTESFIIYIKIDDICKDTSIWLDRLLPLPDELAGKNMTKFVALRAKTYSYLMGRW